MFRQRQNRHFRNRNYPGNISFGGIVVKGAAEVAMGLHQLVPGQRGGLGAADTKKGLRRFAINGLSCFGIQHPSEVEQCLLVRE